MGRRCTNNWDTLLHSRCNTGFWLRDCVQYINSLTCAEDLYGSSFKTGDSYQILRATFLTPDSSRYLPHGSTRTSYGNLFIRDRQSNRRPTPTGWSSQTLEPIYEFADTHSGNFGSAVYIPTASLLPDRDVYSEASASANTSPTSPFNGATGTGFGTLANRPATCTTGVAYWAQDQGNWNQSGSGSQGELYICTSTNTWTMRYEPYIYPHPLTSATTTGQPSPPTNLNASPR